MTWLAESGARPPETAPGHSLRALQDWLQAAIRAPGPERGSGLLGGCEEHIRSGPGLGAAERVALYARGYLARLQECLRADHPALRALVGDALFERFVVGFLWSNPPRGHDLAELGTGFASYLERTRPPDGAVPEAHRALLDLPVDLVRVERARLEALRAPGLEDAARAPVPGPHELLLGTEVVVSAAPCLRITETRHDVRDFLAAMDRGEPPEPPPEERTLLAVSRVDFRPTLTPLHDWQREALACCDTPRPLSELAARLAALRGESEGAVRADLALWLPVAREQGLVNLEHGSDKEEHP
jgi:hypothetical protein